MVRGIHVVGIGLGVRSGALRVPEINKEGLPRQADIHVLGMNCY